MARNRILGGLLLLAQLAVACGSAQPEVAAPAPVVSTTTTTTSIAQPVENPATPADELPQTNIPTPDALALATEEAGIQDAIAGSRNVAIAYDIFFSDRFGDLEEANMQAAYLALGAVCEGFASEETLHLLVDDERAVEELAKIDPLECEPIYFTWEPFTPGSDPTGAATWDRMIELRLERMWSWGTDQDFEEQARTVCDRGLRGLDISAFSTLTLSAELEIDAIVQHGECGLLTNETSATASTPHLNDHLLRWYADDQEYFDDAAMVCMTELTEQEQDPPVAVMNLIVLYCAPDLYIDAWGASVVLPGAPGAEHCFARVVVEHAVSGSLVDAAWFGIDRWNPPEPVRTEIARTLDLECGFGEAEWIAAGLVGPSAIDAAPDSASRRQFCTDLFDVEYAARPLVDAEDAAAFLADSEWRLASYSALDAPASLTEEFEAFLAAEQATVDVLRDTGWTMTEYFDAALTSVDVGLTAQQEAALGRFLDFNYVECYE